MIEYLVCECAHLVETCERTSSRDSGSNLCKGLCFDLLVDEATFGGSGVECGHKTLQVGDAIGVLTTTSEGDEYLTISGGAHGFDGGRSKSVDHDN